MDFSSLPWFLDLGYLSEVFFYTLIAYIGVIVVLRFSGKRSLAKWNIFDFIITIAIGTTLATTVMSTGDSEEMRKGIMGFLLLIIFQYAITTLSVHFDAFAKIIKSKPALLVYNGEYLDKAMKQERLTKSEVLAAMRNQGIANLSEVGAVILENNGTLSVLGKWETDSVDSLSNVHGYEDVVDSNEESA